MKLNARQIDGFLRAPGTSWVLLYGPDGGLVRERAAQLAARVAGDVADPFRVVEVPAASLRDDPARLADEADALSLSGGRRVVRLRDAGDAVTRLLEPLVEGPAPAAFVIVEAGELGPRSTLRQLFERSPAAAALPCYHDEGATLGALIDSTLKAAGLGIAPEARAYLLEQLGGDRSISRGELEKLVVYMGPPTEAGAPRQVTLDDALACIGDSAAGSLDDIAFAIGDGDLAALERTVERGLQAGAAPVTMLRAVARHFLRLHQAGAMAASGGGAERAVKALRPPVHYRHLERFQRQLRRWDRNRLATAIDRLLETEAACKRTGAPAETLMRRAFLDMAQLAGPARGRR